MARSPTRSAERAPPHSSEPGLPPLRAEHSKTISGMQNVHDTTVDTLQRDRASELKQTHEHHEKKHTMARDEHDEVLSRLKSSHSAVLQETVEKHEAKLSGLTYTCHAQSSLRTAAQPILYPRARHADLLRSLGNKSSPQQRSVSSIRIVRQNAPSFCSFVFDHGMLGSSFFLFFFSARRFER